MSTFSRRPGWLTANLALILIACVTVSAQAQGRLDPSPSPQCKNYPEPKRQFCARLYRERHAQFAQQIGTQSGSRSMDAPRRTKVLQQINKSSELLRYWPESLNVLCRVRDRGGMICGSLVAAVAPLSNDAAIDLLKRLGALIGRMGQDAANAEVLIDCANGAFASLPSLANAGAISEVETSAGLSLCGSASNTGGDAGGGSSGSRSMVPFGMGNISLGSCTVDFARGSDKFIEETQDRLERMRDGCEQSLFDSMKEGGGSDTSSDQQDTGQQGSGQQESGQPTTDQQGEVQQGSGEQGGTSQGNGGPTPTGGTTPPPADVKTPFDVLRDAVAGAREHVDVRVSGGRFMIIFKGQFSCLDDFCNSCKAFMEELPTLEESCAKGGLACQNLGRALSCCESSASKGGGFADPHVLLPNPDGSYACVTSSSAAGNSDACQARCSVAGGIEADHCIARCTAANSPRATPFSLMDGTCARAISEGCFASGGIPIPERSGPPRTGGNSPLPVPTENHWLFPD